MTAPPHHDGVAPLLLVLGHHLLDMTQAVGAAEAVTALLEHYCGRVDPQGTLDGQECVRLVAGHTNERTRGGTGGTARPSLTTTNR